MKAPAADPLEALADALAPLFEQRRGRQFLAQKHNPPATTPSGLIYSHGPGGLLSFPGVDQEIFHTVMGQDSIISMIPTMPSLYTNPTYFTITGVQDVTGSEIGTVCDDAPVAGLMKGCLTTSVFGRYDRSTPVLDMTRMGQQVDRADPMDLRLIGSPYGGQNGPFGQPGVGGTPSDLLTNELSRKFWERNVALYRLLSRQVWNGTPVNNLGGGGYREMTGLSLLVNTGYQDAETGQLCSAMDSHISSFTHGRIDGNVNATVAHLTNVYHQLKEKARRSGVAPVRWVMAMRSNLFYELSAIWPCSYLTFRCLSASTSTPEFINAQDAVRFRDEMRAGSYLLIDGERVEVIADDGITELDGNSSGGNFPKGCFESDIYFLPMSIVGGRSVLYMEYYQYSNPAIEDAFGNMILGRIEGPWITWPKQDLGCIQWQSRIEPRLVLRTPWLAARIQQVVYCPIEHDVEPFPTDPYFKNGGKTSRPGPSYDTLWS